MSSNRKTKPSRGHSHRIFAEDSSGSGSGSGSESGLDILESTRKGLDLSQYIEAVTSQSQSQSQSQKRPDGYASIHEISEISEMDEPQPVRRRPHQSRTRHQKGRRAPSSDTELEEHEKISEPDWSDDDPTAAYREFKERKTLKRKRVAAETNRIRAQKKSKAEAATSIIGRKPQVQPKHSGKPVRIFSTASESEKVDSNDTYLDDPTPEYIETRKRKLKKLHEAGLRVPPSYDDIDFSDSDSDEKPILHRDVRRQRAKKNIKIRKTGGIIPAPIAQWLRDYQLDGVEFLHERFVRQTGAILGDDMGLGKTIQVIAFLTAAFGKTATKCDAKRMRKVRRVGDDRWYPRVMIICPGTLMQNWESELEKWGWWQVYKYHGAPEDRRGVLAAAKRGMAEIMITTYTTYRNNEGEINTIDWDCVIADECHQIKNKEAAITKAMNRVNALCRIGLTGTAIQNKYEELWNLLNWARPGDYGSAQEWRQLISTPLKVGQAHDATNAQLANARSKAQELVTKILPDVFLRRMKALIADQLPKKSDRVVFCQLTAMQADAYRAYIESDRCEYIRTAKQPCDCNSGKARGWCCHQTIPGEDSKWGAFMFPAMITLQKLSNHIGLLLPQITENQDKQAKDMENLQLAFPDNWQDLDRIKNSVLQQSQREFCGKWKVLKRLLDFWNSNGDKVLVFSHSVRLLRLLKSLFDLDGTKYNFSYLDGSMTYDDRSKAVADFNSDPNQFVFLISTKAGGVGLNITSANKVVVVDPNWNPAYDLQAQDRAYRIGQTRDVEVFRLVSSGTIEEIVYARQIYKQQQANIGYTASDERRYFKGVMDEKGKVGELFGLQNLFSFEESGYLLRDIVHKTNVAETKAGVNALDFKIAEDDNDLESSDDDDILSNKALGITDDDGPSTSATQLKKFADSFIGTADSSSSSKARPNKKKYVKDNGAADPNKRTINAILAKAGVQYTHENSEVIGQSRVEAELSRRAMEVKNDLEMSGQQVFAASQSQSQLQPGALRLGYIEPEQDVGDSEEDNDNDDVRIVGLGKGNEQFKINYRYRPNESIRKRQFCSMAQIMGYEDPIEFALVVEDTTQEERSRMLEKFYRARRRQVQEEFKAV